MRVLMMPEFSCQVNDSYIIFKTLAPLVFGRAMSEAEAAQIKSVSYEGKLKHSCVCLLFLAFLAGSGQHPPSFL